MKKIICGIVVVLACAAFGRHLWYVNEDDSGIKSWDYAPAWTWNDGNAGLPTVEDAVTFDSMHLNAAVGRAPITITNGTEAVCDTMAIATTAWGSGSSYRDDGRIIGVRMTGGTLKPRHAGDDLPGISVGQSAAGYGVFDFSGGTIDAGRVHVGDNGIGVMTNSGGNVFMRNYAPWATRFIVGSNRGSQGEYIMNGGTITCANNPFDAQVWIGDSGEGRFDWSGGTISNGLIIGRSKGGRGTLEMSGGELQNWLFVGDQPGATGVVNMTAGLIAGDVTVGNKGCGTLTLSGSARFRGWKSVFVGRDKDSAGRLVLRPDSSTPWESGDNNTLYVAYHGDGEVEIDGNVQYDYVKIGMTNSVYGSLQINEGKTVGVNTQLSIGGAAVPTTVNGTDHNTQEGGRGELLLRGGTVRFTNNQYGNQNLFLGRYASENPGSFGLVHGWGNIAPASEDINNVRMAMGDGQIIADGFGKERTLDFNAVVNISNITENAVSSTNGWYAVNKGCVLYPRTWFGRSSPITKFFGAFSHTDHDGRNPDFVNSVKFTMRGVQHDQNHFRGGLYAADRSDVHAAELPENSEVVGIWKFGLFSGVNGTDRVGFDSIDITFRYDHTKVKNFRTLVLSRWNDTTGRWEKLISTAPTADCCITATNMNQQRVGHFNVGLFALTTRTPGMTIFIK